GHDSARALYAHLAQEPIRASVAAMSIIHDNTYTTRSYWVVAPCSSNESPFLHRADLNTVCWLQVDGVVPGIPNGLFDVYVLVNFRGRSSGQIEALFRARPDSGSPAEYKLIQGDRAVAELVGRGWQAMYIGRIAVTSRSSSVNFSIFGGNPWWC